MIKAAVVGLGWWGTTIVKSLKDSGKIEVIAGVDIDEARCKPFTQDHNIGFYNSLEDALLDEGVDSVIIATPHLQHEDMVLAAAEAGKNIFCEKPFSLTSDSAQRMIQAAEEKGLVLGIGHERRFEGAFEEIKRMHDAGELGTLLHLEFNASYNFMVKSPPAGWRQDPAQAPAGMMTALGVHQTDFMQTLAGPVAEIYAQLKRRSDDYPNEDVLTCQMVFESGVTGSFTSLATTPFYQRMSVFGDRGWVENREVSNVDKPDPAVLTWRGMDEEIHTRTYQVADTVKPNFEAWADAVMGNGTYRFSHAEILHNVQILHTIVRSIESGKPEAIA